MSSLLFARLGHGKLKFYNEGMLDLKGIFELLIKPFLSKLTDAETSLT